MNARDPHERHVGLPGFDMPAFHLYCRPASQPPPQAAHPRLWSIQLRWLANHTPHPGERTCKYCTQLWPCESWLLWDDLLHRSLGLPLSSTSELAAA